MWHYVANVLSQQSYRLATKFKKSSKKIIIGCILLFFIFSILGNAYAKSLELKRRSAEYIVDIELERNPPIVGVNMMKMSIKDNRGKFLEGLNLSVNYYMLPTPRMIPMNFTIPAKPYKHYYRVSMNFIMSGPWVVAVKIPTTGKTRTIKFNIDIL